MKLFLLWLVFQPLPADAHTWNEVKWSAHICKTHFGQEPVNGTTVEVQTPDGARADIVTKEFVYEVDWCKSGKWAEAIGQSLYYAAALNKKPGIVLLMKDADKERKYYLRALAVCNKYDIKLIVQRVP
jgi:hypothetical protein